MGISTVVFDERVAPADGEVWDWIRAQREAAPVGAWQRPETSLGILNSWFREMRESFPLIQDADPDDLHGTEYCFYQNFVEVVFAGPVGEEGVITAWKLAYKHGLRILVGDELLPRVPSEGEKRIHISVLDGSKTRAEATGRRNACIGILDPAFAPAGDAKQWVLDQLDVEAGSDDPSIVGSDRLKRWKDEFRALDLSHIPRETKFFREFILLRIRPKDLNTVIPELIELGKRLRVGLALFENL